jgi:hypothetical protein
VGGWFDGPKRSSHGEDVPAHRSSMVIRTDMVVLVMVMVLLDSARANEKKPHDFDSDQPGNEHLRKERQIDRSDE